MFLVPYPVHWQTTGKFESKLSNSRIVARQFRTTHLEMLHPLKIWTVDSGFLVNCGNCAQRLYTTKNIFLSTDFAGKAHLWQFRLFQRESCHDLPEKIQLKKNGGWETNETKGNDIYGLQRKGRPWEFLDRRKELHTHERKKWRALFTSSGDN